MGSGVHGELVLFETYNVAGKKVASNSNSFLSRGLNAAMAMLSSMLLWSLHPNPSSTNNCRRRLAISLLFVIVNLLQWNAVLISTSSSPSSSEEATTTLPLPLATVAYAISITSCTNKLSYSLFDAASVLRQSILLNSWPLHPTSQYGATFYAFTMANTEQPRPSSLSEEENDADQVTAMHYQDECSRILSLAGWEVLPQSRPVSPELIKEPEGSILKMGIGR